MNNKFAEKEIMKATKKKHLEINLTKEVKDMYNKKYKTLMKETGDKTNGKTSHNCGFQ
jgi:hypothetical protein